MKTDLYTKIVLTVIAIALTANVVKSFFVTPAQASNSRIVSVPVNADGTINVNITGINANSWAFSNSAPIPVVVKTK